jgi:hypothetical protein
VRNRGAYPENPKWTFSEETNGIGNFVIHFGEVNQLVLFRPTTTTTRPSSPTHIRLGGVERRRTSGRTTETLYILVAGNPSIMTFPTTAAEDELPCICQRTHSQLLHSSFNPTLLIPFLFVPEIHRLYGFIPTVK